ncbi:MAG: SMP-30/gluconolactonase/LRE family protein [Verrucomicrobiales bacterium]
MNARYLLILTLLFAVPLHSSLAQKNAPTAIRKADNYPVHDDSRQHDGIPAGKIIAGIFDQSEIFPGTTRNYWIYIPEQYKQARPACLMVFQDGRNYINRDRGFRVPNVFDNLIHKGDMPATIALFINPGIIPAANKNAEARYNRSFEYDSMGDRYARFLINEMIPLLKEKHGLNISKDPDDRGICGSSSGGICAFTVCWERPDAFRRVYTTVGTYVGLRGGNEYPTLIRKTEPKPVRVFLQDGKNDLNIYGGDWWMANQTMLRALQFSGYEVNHAFGDGGHNGKHGSAILPDVLRWLWRDHGKIRVATHYEQCKNRAPEYLIDGEGWEIVVEDGTGWYEGLACTADGTLYYTDVPNSKLYRLRPGGKPELLDGNTGRTNGISIGPDGRLYGAAAGARQIRSWDLMTGESLVVGEGTKCNDIVVRHDGKIYYTDPQASRIRMLKPGNKTPIDVDTFERPNGIGLSADQTLLFVANFTGRFIYSYTIAGDGSLKNKQPYFHMHLPHGPETEARLDGMCTTRDGLLVASSDIGIQICDQPGRVQLILPRPPGAIRRTCYATFGGPDHKTLYVATPEAIYKRKTKLTGVDPTKMPVKPPRPRL